MIIKSLSNFPVLFYQTNYADFRTIIFPKQPNFFDRFIENRKTCPLKKRSAKFNVWIEPISSKKERGLRKLEKWDWPTI